MATFASIKARYDGLVTQSTDLFAKVSKTTEGQRITFEDEVNALDLAVMRLARLIQKNPALINQCNANINLDLLRSKIGDVNELLYKFPKSDSLSQVALKAFSFGAVGGAISGIVQNAANTPSLPDAEPAADLSVKTDMQKDRPSASTSLDAFRGKLGISRCASNVAISDIENQRRKIEEAQKALQQAEQLRNQAQGKTGDAYIQLLDNVDISLLPPGITVNAGGAISDSPILIQANILEGAANTQYNEALVRLGQEQAALAHLERDYNRQNPPPERGGLGIVWDGAKFLVKIVFKIFSKDY